MQHTVVCKYSTFIKAHASSLKTCSTWKLNSAYDWWLQNCKLGNEWIWVNRNAMIGYTWLLVYESPRRYQGRMNVGPSCNCRSFNWDFTTVSCIRFAAAGKSSEAEEHPLSSEEIACPATCKCWRSGDGTGCPYSWSF